jgi:hypothetical protein
MSSIIGVLAIHGMGDQPEHFADDLFADLRRHLGSDAASVAFQSCYWSDVLQHHQDQVWQRLKRSGVMSWPGSRQWILSSFGDPPAYLSGFFRSGQQAYGIVHERVRSALRQLERQLGPQSKKSLIILAHSLGSVIVTNYIWDEQKRATTGTTPFERTETLTTLVTYGSNIPLFLPPVRPIECIQFPWPSLPDRSRDRARWLNIYAPSDLLGYPLGNIWDNAHGTVIHDRAIHAGFWPISRTPLSHAYYESDGRFLRIVVDEIRSVLGLSSAGSSV